MRVVVVLGALEHWRTKRKWGFGFAVIAFLGTFALRYALDDWLPPGVPFLSRDHFDSFFYRFVADRSVDRLIHISGLVLFSATGSNFRSGRPPAAFALGFFAVVATIMIILIHALNVAIDRLRDERARARIIAQQRETMFTELQHRISNKLQLVAALLNLETGNVADQSAKKALDEASKRLALIGKLHRNLYDPEGAGLPRQVDKDDIASRTEHSHRVDRNGTHEQFARARS